MMGCPGHRFRWFGQSPTVPLCLGLGPNVEERLKWNWLSAWAGIAGIPAEAYTQSGKLGWLNRLGQIGKSNLAVWLARLGKAIWPYDWPMYSGSPIGKHDLTGTWYQVPGAWHQVLGSGIRYLLPVCDSAQLTRLEASPDWADCSIVCGLDRLLPFPFSNCSCRCGPIECKAVSWWNMATLGSNIILIPDHKSFSLGCYRHVLWCVLEHPECGDEDTDSLGCGVRWRHDDYNKTLSFWGRWIFIRCWVGASGFIGGGVFVSPKVNTFWSVSE